MRLWKKSIDVLLHNQQNVETKEAETMILLSDRLQLVYDSETTVSHNCSVKLTDSCLYYRFSQQSNADSKEDELRLIPVSDIIGCRVEDNKSTVLLHVYAYPLRAKAKLNVISRQLKRTKNTVIFGVNTGSSFEENIELATKWRRTILWLISNKSQVISSDSRVKIPDVIPQQRRLLVLINPASGPGKATEIFDNKVVPIFKESDICYKVVITKYSKCGVNYIRDATDLLTLWDGIVVVSGDGLLFEVFNGLMQRDDWEKTIRIPIGIIPGGSGNGIAHSINYAVGEPASSNPIVASALNVVRGRSVPMDLVRVKTANETLYSCLSIGWGLIADIDIESETLRAVGGARFTIWAVIRTMGLRKYKGRLSYLPLPGYFRPKVPMTQNFMSSLVAKNSTFHCRPDCCRKTTTGRNSLNASHDSNISCDEQLTEVDDIESESSKCYSNHNLKCSSAFENSKSDWITVEGDFVLVYSSYQTHISSDCFFTPGAKFDDGIIWLVYIMGSATRAQILQFLTSLNSGHHVNLPFVCSVPVRSFKLEPKGNEGRITVDGELVECGPICAEVLPSIARLMTR